MAGIKAIAKKLVGGSSRLLFPPVCTGCRRIVSLPGVLCAECWIHLRFIEQPWCEVLGVPFDYDFGEGTVSVGAISDPPSFDRARAAVAYRGIATKLVHALKYRDRTDLGPWMARWMLRPGADLLRTADLIVPVPLHPRRFLLRRFNQSAELARALANLCGVAFLPWVAERSRNTIQQVGLGVRQRTENVRGSFIVPEHARGTIRGRRILLVDDVLTTGATVSALAGVLKKHGAGGVDVLTFARVLPGDFRPDEAGPI